MSTFWLVVLGTLAFCSTENTDFGSCIYKILNAYPASSIIYVHNEESNIYFPPNTTVISVNTNLNMGFVAEVPLSDYYVIEYNNLTFVEVFLKTHYLNILWRPGVRVILLGHHELKKMFKIFWKYLLVNVVVVLGDLHVYTYYPISGGCNVHKPVYIGSCQHLELEIFNESSTSRFDNCKFTLGYIPQAPYIIEGSTSDPGLWMRLNEEAGHALKYQLILKRSMKVSVVNPNGSYMGLIRDVKEGTVDIFTSIFTRHEFLQDFNFIVRDTSIPIIFWVHVSKKRGNMTNIVHVYSPRLWQGLFVALGLILSACYLLKSKELGSFRSYLHCALIVWKTMFSANNRWPKTRTFKSLMLLWTCMAFILASAYQGSLSSTLFLSKYEDQVDTVDKLAATNRNITMLPAHQIMLESFNTTMSKAIEKNIETTYILGLGAITSVLQDVNTASLLDVRMLSYYWRRIVDKTGASRLYGINTGSSFPFTIIFRKGLPIFEPFQIFSARVLEQGLMEKWDSYRKIPKFPQRKVGMQKIALSHLTLPLLFLLGGLLLGFLVFCVEVFNRFCRKKLSRFYMRRYRTSSIGMYRY